VIFHPQERPTTIAGNTTDVNETSAAYRMYLERRLLLSDRGNLTCGGKCFTSVEIEDARDEIEEKKSLKVINLTLKRDDSDVDRMDMSTTIRNIENIYPRRSVASKSSSWEIPNDEVVENTEVDHLLTSKLDISQPKESDKTDKINKRVSFNDKLYTSEVSDSMRSQGLNNIDREPNVQPASPLKQRPKSSKERSELLFKLQNKPKRPCTAPPCSPRYSRDASFLRELNLAPIRVPTSEEVLSDREENDNGREENADMEDVERSKLESDNEINSSDRSTADGQPAMRVLVACKSAPNVRVTSTTQEHISRSMTSMSSRTNKNKYIPPKPIAVFADSSMELPPNLPPAQALVELRRKIREDLAKETADLQLDIQQLYLKHHTDY
jgi:hypothetical protein